MLKTTAQTPLVCTSRRQHYLQDPNGPPERQALLTCVSSLSVRAFMPVLTGRCIGGAIV